VSEEADSPTSQISGFSETGSTFFTKEEQTMESQSGDISPMAKPKMGDIHRAGTDSTPWTGGKPNVDWSGLDALAPTVPKTPNQFRPTKPSDNAKAYNQRRGKGAAELFKPSDDVIMFTKTLWKHLVDTGMDSIAYLQDPEKKNEMSSVVTESARHTLERAKVLCKAQLKEYDEYDVSNDSAALDHLLASLDPALRIRLEEKLTGEEAFPIAWLYLKPFPSPGSTSCV